MKPNYKVTVTWSNGFKHSYETMLTPTSKEHLEAHYATLTHVKKVTYREIKGK